MEEKGYLIARVFTGRQAIPVEDVSVSVLTDGGGEPELIAFRTTGRDGRTEPVAIVTPARENTEEPSGRRGFATCNVQLDHPEYFSVLVEHVQIFSEVESIQTMEMVPLPEATEPDERGRVYEITPQDL